MGGIAQRVINSIMDRTNGLDDIHDDLTTMDTVVDAIKAKTDNLPVDPADESLLETDIADLITRTKGLNDIHDDVTTVDTVVDGIQTDLSNATDGLSALKALIDANQTDLNTVIGDVGTVDTVVDAIKTKTDLMNSGSGGSTLNDANVSDTIVPPSLPCNMHVAFNITAISVADDDFTIEVKVGASGSEQVIAYYKITSDGTDTSIDTGSGTASKVKAGRIDISDILVYTGEQVLLNYTKTSATDRNVPYEYICGV